MHDGVEFLPMKEIAHRHSISQIDLMQRDIFRHRRDVLVLYARIIIIVEIIQNCDLMAIGQ